MQSPIKLVERNNEISIPFTRSRAIIYYTAAIFNAAVDVLDIVPVEKVSSFLWLKQGETNYCVPVKPKKMEFFGWYVRVNNQGNERMVAMPSNSFSKLVISSLANFLFVFLIIVWPHATFSVTHGKFAR